MSVPQQDPINQVPIVGGESTLPWTWNLQIASELMVLRLNSVTQEISELSLDVDYTVDETYLDNDDGGLVTPIGDQAPVQAGDVWTFFRVTAIDRSPDFETSGAFFALTVNEQMDELTRICQDINRDAGDPVRKNPGIGDNLDPLIPQMIDGRALKMVNVAPGDYEIQMSEYDPDQQAGEAAAFAEESKGYRDESQGYSQDSANSAVESANSAQDAENSALASAASAQESADSAVESADEANKGLLKNSVEISADIILDATYQGFEVRVDTSAGDIEIYLPDSSNLTENFRVSIVKVTSDLNKILVGPLGLDQLNGGVVQVEQSDQYVRAIYALDQSEATWIASLETVSPPPVLETGTMIEWPGNEASIPDTWALCDGSVKNATADPTFLALFNLIGNTYGGSDQTNFQVPDRRGRVCIGLDNMGGTPAEIITDPNADTLGGKGGTYVIPTFGNVSTGFGGVNPTQPHTNDQPWIAMNIIIKK